MNPIEHERQRIAVLRANAWIEEAVGEVATLEGLLVYAETLRELAHQTLDLDAAEVTIINLVTLLLEARGICESLPVLRDAIVEAQSLGRALQCSLYITQDVLKIQALRNAGLELKTVMLRQVEPDSSPPAQEKETRDLARSAANRLPL